MAERPLDSDRQLLGHDIEGDQLRHRSFSYFFACIQHRCQGDAYGGKLRLSATFPRLYFLGAMPNAQSVSKSWRQATPIQTFPLRI